MVREKIKVSVKRKQDLRALAKKLGELGFSKVAYSSAALIIEKIKGEDINGKTILDFQVEFKNDSITLNYEIPSGRNRLSRLLETLPTFLNILQTSDDFYDIKAASLFGQLNQVLEQSSKVIDKEAIEFSTRLAEVEDRYSDLRTKYEDLVRSSEMKTRILLECEQKKEELSEQIAKLTKLSNQTLREMLYNWIKMHGGRIDIREFSKVNSIAIARIEEGLNALIMEGYIKRRTE